MLAGLAWVAIAAMVADLAGNGETRWFTRRVFGVVVLLELQVASTVGGVAKWGADALISLL